MKTLGEIFKNKREEKKLTFEDVEKVTKIRKKYIMSIESGNYDELPPAAFTRGFIKNYSDFLGLDSNVLLAMYRRDFDELKDKRLLPKGVSEVSEGSLWRITPTKVTVTLVSLVATLFLAYLFFQYKNLAGAPALVILKPGDNSIVSSKEVQVLGKTDIDVVVKINDQQVENNNGNFSQILHLSNGVNTISVTATSGNGKSSKIERHVRVEE